MIALISRKIRGAIELWNTLYKGPKLLMCRIISLLEQYFLLLITFCTYFFKCINFKKSNYVKEFYQRAPWLSRVMSIFAIKSHQYNNILHSWTNTNIMGCIKKNQLKFLQLIHYYLYLWKKCLLCETRFVIGNCRARQYFLVMRNDDIQTWLNRRSF